MTTAPQTTPATGRTGLTEAGCHPGAYGHIPGRQAVSAPSLLPTTLTSKRHHRGENAVANLGALR